VIFPVHPRTAKTLRELADMPSSLVLVDPQPYLEFNYLVRYAKAVITDSGGITEETTVMGVPCLTLRDTTERPETVSMGTNALIGTDPARLGPALDRLFSGDWPKGRIPELWDGHTGERIVAALERLLCGQQEPVGSGSMKA
jgi:UDP-N-acetylglucosamine 2-epimerase (non-hydrolysing)